MRNTAQQLQSFFEPADNTPQEALAQTRVLIVDDQSTGRKILERIIQDLSPHLRVDSFADPLAALQHIQTQTPDLILVDYKMPGLNGLQFTHQVRQTPGCADVPLVIVTVIQDIQVRYQALQAGATDFLTRPIDQVECLARCRNLLQLRTQQKLVRDHSLWLEKKVAEATAEVQQREQETLMILARAGEYRDNETGCHIVRMAKYTRILADALQLPPAECEAIERAAPLHDIGKLGIPDAILLKPGKLTEAEFAIMKNHARIGSEILSASRSPLAQLGGIIAGGHHEKYDGSGYPNQLKGEAIPLAARIVAVADVFDALSSERPYKRPWSEAEILAYLQAQSGHHFDPQCVQVFLREWGRVMMIQRQSCAYGK